MDAQMRAQMPQTVMENCGPYYGNNTNRNAQMSARLDSNLGLRNPAPAELSGDGHFYM